ncbi:DinB family protein [Algoriphagus machipongonensis]|uniref:DNA polymerase, DinB family n=1 Tax=Algoriphagus machipongonensis TaxID=388413 RepID=A3HV27_9BACT|nr:putative DNA polymerase, DinB family [Algoriphagus machipongonensis]
MTLKSEEIRQRYLDYALYNLWANKRLISTLSEQDEALLSEELIGSFPSIRKTVLHIWFAETGWLSRLNNKGWDVKKVDEFSGSNSDLFREWNITSEDFKDFTSKADLEEEIQFEHKNEKFSIPAREIIQTVLNHGTYHRGQLVMMMRQLGISKIPQTDYIEWVREKARGNIK